MMRVIFFRLNKPKKFHIHARYYDPEKEALNERKRQREQRLSGDNNLREEMARKWHRKTQKKSTSMTLVYLVVLFLIILYIFTR
jgi:hypothetical protein